MTDRIEEIKACSKKGINYREDVPFLIGEIDRLKMMLDAALEKQIPKKPNKFDGYQCSECGGKLARQTDLVKQHYCHHCGQALEW